MTRVDSQKEKCPVCGYVLDSKAQPVKVGHHVILVCCQDCERKVRANPTKYIRAK
jgi:ribosome-binding protein aMBF1 (putative translation factor)